MGGNKSLLGAMPTARKIQVQYIFVMTLTVHATWENSDVLNVKPRQNIWITWANLSGVTDFCLRLQGTNNPFRTCLIGIPLDSFEEFAGYVQNASLPSITTEQACKQKYKTAQWCAQSQGMDVGKGELTLAIANSLNKAAIDSQELDLLGSVPSNYCVFSDWLCILWTQDYVVNSRQIYHHLSQLLQANQQPHQGL